MNKNIDIFFINKEIRCIASSKELITVLKNHHLEHYVECLVIYQQKKYVFIFGEPLSAHKKIWNRLYDYMNLKKINSVKVVGVSFINFSQKNKTLIVSTNEVLSFIQMPYLPINLLKESIQYKKIVTLKDDQSLSTGKNFLLLNVSKKYLEEQYNLKK